MLTTAFQGTVIFMAIGLLESQVQHIEGEEAARRRGRPGPPRLSVERKAYHDLEALIWVLIYAMMIHNYNSLTREIDRKSYKKILDDYFGHGSAQMVLDKRHAILSSARADVSRDRVSKWFPNSDERNFFISCMSLIAKHYRPEKTTAKWKTPVGDINDDVPPWGRTDDESDNSLSPDEDAKDTSGTYGPVKATKASQTLAAGSRIRPPIITYESVISLLINSINELQ